MQLHPAILCVGFISIFAIRVDSQTNPICYVCGDPDKTVGEPDAILTIPDNPFTDISEATCAQLEYAGLSGMVPGIACSIVQNQPIFEQTCLCKSKEDSNSIISNNNAQTTTSDNTDVPTKMPSAAPSTLASAGSSNSPVSNSPSLYPEKKSKTLSTAPEKISYTPSKPPSIQPSSAPSTYPFSAPSGAPSNAPSSQIPILPPSVLAYLPPTIVDREQEPPPTEMEMSDVCNVCGSEDRKVGNPKAVINIPNNPFLAMEQVTCGQVELAGLFGMIPTFACPFFGGNMVFKLYCHCEDNVHAQESIVQSVSPSGQPSVQPSNVPSDLPSTISPSDVPSDLPSTMPSNQPSDLPSIAPSSVPSVSPPLSITVTIPEKDIHIDTEVEARNVCNVCGGEDRRVGNPTASVRIPNNPFINAEKVTCQQVEIAGLVGLIPSFACPMFAENAVFKLYCSCEDNYDDQTAMNYTEFPKNSTVNDSYSKNETETLNVRQKSNHDQFLKVPTSSPASPEFKKDHKSGQAPKQSSMDSNIQPSMTPKQSSLMLPSILPSFTPSTQPSSSPSILVSNAPSVLPAFLLLEFPEIKNENNTSERGPIELGDSCYVCGNEGRKVGNPNAEVIMPNNPFVDLEQVTCQQVELAGRFGMIPLSVCPFFETNIEFQRHCNCEDKYYTTITTEQKSQQVVLPTTEDMKVPSNSDRKLQFGEAILSLMSSNFPTIQQSRSIPNEIDEDAMLKAQAPRRRLRVGASDFRP
jgi:hypothetical protein